MQQKSASRVHRGVNAEGKIFMSCVGIGEQDDNIKEYEESKDNDFANYTMDQFVPENFNSKFKSTAIFSTHKPETIIA